MGFSKEREQEQAVVRQFLRLLFGLFGLLLLLQFRLLLISLLLSVLLLLLSLLLVLLSVLTIFLILIHNLDFLVVGRDCPEKINGERRYVKAPRVSLPECHH